MKSIQVVEAQAKLAEIIAELQFGEEILVRDGDTTLGKIVGMRKRIAQRPGPGLFRGKLRIIAEDDEHLNDFRDYME